MLGWLGALPSPQVQHQHLPGSVLQNDLFDSRSIAAGGTTGQLKAGGGDYRAPPDHCRQPYYLHPTRSSQLF